MLILPTERQWVEWGLPTSHHVPDESGALVRICYSVDIQQGDHDSTCLWENCPPPPKIDEVWVINSICWLFSERFLRQYKQRMYNQLCHLSAYVNSQYWDPTKSHIHYYWKVHNWIKSFSIPLLTVLKDWMNPDRLPAPWALSHPQSRLSEGSWGRLMFYH